MNYYLEITLLPDAEANLGFLWQKVFQQVHIALVENKIADNESAVALSIVGYGAQPFPLGDKLRLLANNEDVLQKLNMPCWLNRLADYCHIKAIKPVPGHVSHYACFKRKPVKSIEKKAHRRAQHLNKPYEEVLAYLLNEGRSVPSKLPFINVESQETKKRAEQGVSSRFLLFIDKKVFNHPVEGKFDCYGLSKTATVPCWD